MRCPDCGVEMHPRRASSHRSRCPAVLKRAPHNPRSAPLQTTPRSESKEEAKETKRKPLPRLSWCEVCKIHYPAELPHTHAPQSALKREGGRQYPDKEGGRQYPDEDALALLAPWFDRLRLRDWQREALQAWADHGCWGVVEAVTGTGKTHLGLAAIAWAVESERKALVVVPTTVLQSQWFDDVKSWLGWIRVGRLGNGHTGNFADYDVLIATVQSCLAHLAALAHPNAVLIADECHRYGADGWSQVLQPKFRYRLGLTATFERSDDGVAKHLEPYFAGVCYQLGYGRALADKLIARFEVALVGTTFTPEEEEQYERFGQQARDAWHRLIYEHNLPKSPYGVFMKRVQELGRSDRPGSGEARAYLKAFAGQRRILAEAQGKMKRLTDLQTAVHKANKALIFTETKAGAEAAAKRLRASGLDARPCHSGLDHEERAQTLEEFGICDQAILAAPKLLDEGVDVPEADLAIVMAGSRQRRQMIQRLGRVLRSKDDGRNARLVIMYVAGTPEDPERGGHKDFLYMVHEAGIEERQFPANSAPCQISRFLNDGLDSARPIGKSSQEQPLTPEHHRFIRMAMDRLKDARKRGIDEDVAFNQLSIDVAYSCPDMLNLLRTFTKRWSAGAKSRSTLDYLHRHLERARGRSQ